MRISEAADMTGLSVSNIRFYEKKGLLTPARNEESRYRNYSDEDIQRLKLILLYRKIDLPVETIYLLFQQNLELKEVLERQEQQLQNQKEMLEGAIALCHKMSQAPDFDQLHVEEYLNYVEAQEAQGKQFAALALDELLEDISEFARLGEFRADPYIGRIFSNVWVMRVLSVVFAVTVVGVGVVQLYLSFQSESTFGNHAVSFIFWTVWLVFWLVSFFQYRFRKNKKPMKKEGDPR